MSELCVYFTFILGERDSIVAEASSKDIIRVVFVIYFTTSLYISLRWVLVLKLVRTYPF
jgi:hypothetical protein